MTRDDIIRMARESCDTDTVDAWHNGFWTLTQEELERFAALVAVAERRAIWNILFDYAGRDDLSDSDQSLIKHLAELIRARGQS